MAKAKETQMSPEEIRRDNEARRREAREERFEVRSKREERFNKRYEKIKDVRASRGQPTSLDEMPLTYDEKMFVGTFKILHGRHNEGNVTYAARTPTGAPQPGMAGDTFKSKSNLLLMNSPGAKKFDVIGEVNEEAVEFNMRGRRPTYTPENPQTLPPEQYDEYQETGRVPVHTGKGEETALGAGGAEGAGGEEGTAESDNDLEDMTVEDLRAVAEEEEVEVPSSARKAEIIEAIRKGRKG